MTARRHRLLRILAALALVAMLAVSGTADAGKPPPSEPAQYTISMANIADGAWGVTSECHMSGGSVLAREGTGPGMGELQANGSDLNLNLHTDVAWSRKYPVAEGAPTSGVFDGCFGVTPSLNGNLFIDFEKDKGQSVVHIIWHFDYYLASGVREWFTLQSEHIPFPEWDGQYVSDRVSGTFDLQYSLREGNKPVESYTSLTDGEGRLFDFLLTITRVS